MEAGRVMGVAKGGALLLPYPASIGWVPASVEQTQSGYSEESKAEPLAPVPIWWTRPRFQGWRCARCELVLFSYREDA